MRLFFAWMTILVMAGSILQPQVLASGRRDDTDKVYRDVLIKIDTVTKLQGSVHYRRVKNQVELKMVPAAQAGIVQEIEEASERNQLYINALGDSATNWDFQHRHIKFIKMSNDRKTWIFELLE